MQLWSPSQRLPMVDQQLGEMPKLEAQLNELTNRSLRVVNSASFFLLSELVSVFACNPVMSPLHLLCGVSSQLGFSPQLLVLGIKWGFTGWVRLYRSTNGERIWLPVSFPFKFSKSPRLCVLLYIQATRRKKKKKIKHNSAICKGQVVTSLCIFQVVWVLEWLSNGDKPPMHGLYCSSNLQRVCLGAASSFQLLGHVWLLRL